MPAGGRIGVPVDAPDHDARVRAQFARQAATFTDHEFAARGLDWIVGVVQPSPVDIVADVACGAAHLGRAFAPLVRQVYALDLTPEMLALYQAADPGPWSGRWCGSPARRGGSRWST